MNSSKNYQEYPKGNLRKTTSLICKDLDNNGAVTR